MLEVATGLSPALMPLRHLWRTAQQGVAAARLGENGITMLNLTIANTWEIGKLPPVINGDIFMQGFVTSITATTAFGYLARIVLTYMFWASGIAKLVDFQGAVGEMAHFGLNPPAAFAIATIIVQLVGSALIILDRWTWLGAGMLGVFTALTIPIAHTFWAMEEPFKTIEFYVMMEHITVIGALMVVAWKAER